MDSPSLKDGGHFYYEATAGRPGMGYVSPSAAPMLGYPIEHLTGDPEVWIGTIVHPDDRAAVAEEVSASLRAGRDFQIEYRACRADGEVVWLREVAHVIGDDHGAPVSIRGLVTDITRSRSSEAALRGALARLRLAQEVAGIGTFEWGIQNDVNVWSPEIERLYGLPPGGFEGTYQAWAARVHPDDLAEAERLVRRALETGSFEAEFRIIRPDGGVLWLAGRGLVQRDRQGRPVRMIGANIDITERKRREKALRVSEERLRLAQSAAKIGIWDWNPRSNETAFNAEYYAIMGLEPGTPHGYQDFLALVHPEDRERVDRAMQASLSSGARYSVEHRIRRPDGAERWVAAEGDVATSKEGVGRHILGTVRDITNRKHAEERQVMLVREVDHRAKNILAAVQAMISLSARSQTDLEGFIRTIQSRIQAMAHVHELISEARWHGADLRRIMEDELEPYGSGGQQMATIAGPDLTLKPAAAIGLAMLLHELITNAAKHGAWSVPGGRVEIDWRRGEAGEVLLEWRETGGPPVAAPARGGFGSQLIERGLTGSGAAELRFEPEGVRCSVRLDADQVARWTGPPEHDRAPSSAGRATEQPARSEEPGRLKVLLVEDNALVALDLKCTLDAIGHATVGPAATLQQALTLAEEDGLDAAILDVNLGDDTVFDVAERLAARKIPFAFATGYNASEVLPERHRARPTLRKPYTEAEVEKLLDRLARG
ncbi:MAG TPA: PAS domain-containing protein [Geminicoccaceae bacterium]